MLGSFKASVQGLPTEFWYVWAGTLLNRMGSFIVPFLAVYLTDERKLSTAQAGLIVSLFGLGALVASPVGGLLADKLGRKATMLLGLLPAAVAMAGLGLSREPEMIAVMTFGVGFTSELFRPAVAAFVADVVPPEDRVRAYAALYWAANLGFSVAPVIAGIVAGYSYLALFLADAVTTALYAGLVIWKVRETRPVVDAPAERNEAAAAAQPQSWGYVRKVWQRMGFSEVARDGVFLSFVGLVLLLALIFFQHITTLPLEMRAHGISPRTFGFIIAVNGILIVLFQPSVARWVHRYRRSHVLAVAALLTGVGFGVNAWADVAALYVLGVVIWTLGEIAHAPVASALVADLAPTHARGRYQAVFSMAFGSAFFAGPALGSLVMQRFGPNALWLGCLGLGALIAVGHLAVAAPRRRRMALLRAQGLTAATE